ncbi:hypothetical protein L7F22_043358 [Adiantum nelumboides]|nr:hypothetical protein [Adiantum nelumboides]
MQSTHQRGWSWIPDVSSSRGQPNGCLKRFEMIALLPPLGATSIHKCEGRILGKMQRSKFLSTSAHVQTMIYKQDPLISVLRLLIMLSLTSGGLKQKDFENFRELLHSYGFEYIILLSNLEKAGLLKKQEGKNNIWPHLVKALTLVVEDVDDANPNDIAYVFSGYAPLSVRIVEIALKRGWRSIEAALKLLPGPHLEWSQTNETAGEPRSQETSGIERQENGGVADGRRSLVLVVFIGGVTFAEISALRFLSAQEGMKYDMIIATTKLINGTTLLQTLIDDPSKD